MNGGASTARLLIVNADDFGLTEGVCRAIVKAHREGVVTSTSALAVAPAFVSCASMLDDVPDLGVGVHLAAVGEDPPLLSAREIPSLVDAKGDFAYSWRQFLPRLALGRIDLADLEREFVAQGEAVRDALGPGRITHLDTHQHLHLWPRVGALVCRLAQRWSVPAVRVTRSLGGSPKGRALNLLSSKLARRVDAAGLRSPDAFAGFDEAGAVSTERLVTTIGALAATLATTAEIGVHPGEHADADLRRYQWGYRWGDELDAVLATQAREAVQRAGFTLGSFAALPARS
ncbi:MAG TPA: ChbG/HpnK family deacetylase [Acidimicrobiales bacterium]|nr:ChbG/HpnK family deacetylase [Acidimicrobiales bacterium]